MPAKPSETEPSSPEVDAHKDQVLVLLKRAGPQGLEKDELVQGAGLSPSDLRRAVQGLVEDGEVQETDDGFALQAVDRDAAAVITPRGGSATGGNIPEGEEAESPSASAAAPVGGSSYRVTLGLEASFAAARGPDPDDAASKTAEGIAERIRLVLGEEIPGVEVTLEKLEAYDAPRLVMGRKEEAPDDDEGEGEAG